MNWLILLGAAWAGPGEGFLLDEHPWQECTRPSDDTWIVRMVGDGAITDVSWFTQDPLPEESSAYVELKGHSYLNHLDSSSLYFWASDSPLPYDVEVFWAFSSSEPKPSRVLQDEFSYEWGDEWPAVIESNQRSLYHTLSYDYAVDAKDSFWYDYMITFCSWDSTAYDPEECFVGWTLCISHLRPDRMVMAWTIDASSASRYQEHLPNPVMMVFDEHHQKIAYLHSANVDENFAIEGEWYDITINTVFGDKLLDQTYSGTTEDEVWSHLLTDTGAE